MIPTWFNPLAGLLVSVAALGLVWLVGPTPPDTRGYRTLVRFTCGVLAVAAIVLFAIRLTVTLS